MLLFDKTPMKDAARKQLAMEVNEMVKGLLLKRQ